MSSELDPLATQSLIRAAKGGDASSFERLYERIAPALYTWAELRVRPGMRSQLEPADVVQEVWCRAWRALERFDPETVPFRLWIFRIAKNVLLEAFRQLGNPDRRKAGAGGPSTRMFALQNLPDSVTAVSQRLVRDESLKAFDAMVRSLDEEDQKLVVHVGLEGLPYREAAERLGLSREAVAKRWQRLRTKLLEKGLPGQLLAIDGVG